MHQSWVEDWQGRSTPILAPRESNWELDLVLKDEARAIGASAEEIVSVVLGKI